MKIWISHRYLMTMFLICIASLAMAFNISVSKQSIISSNTLSLDHNDDTANSLKKLHESVDNNIPPESIEQITLLSIRDVSDFMAEFSVKVQSDA